MMRKITLLAASCLLSMAIACTDETAVDVGLGFSSERLSAPWDGLVNGTRFSCHSTADRFWFLFDAVDSTITLKEPFLTKADVGPEDRVEIFLSPSANMEPAYYCAEIDPNGHIMDYRGRFYRDLDMSWGFSSMEVSTMFTPWGYRVGGSVLRSELEELGMDLENGFWMGIFQGDCKKDAETVWYSYVETDDVTPDFHKPDVLFKCKMTPKPERHGVVVYPDDITSAGLDEWEKRFRLSGINMIALHAATVNDPVDTLEALIRSGTGKDFLALCEKHGVDVEYELHALQDILPRGLFESRPEYFRMDENGERQQQYNFCFSSDEAVEAMRPQIEHLLEWMRPTTHRYYFWTDDKLDKFCHCDRCRDYSPSEQALMYENRLLALLREYDPEATLAHLAYNQTLDAPVKVRAAEGIFLEFAPIKRDYSIPLSDEAAEAFDRNRLAFPTHTQHILEYWLDESMFSHWKKDSLQPLPFVKEQCVRDVCSYRNSGICDFTTFATWLNGSYIGTYGSTDKIFKEYGESF